MSRIYRQELEICEGELAKARGELGKWIDRANFLEREMRDLNDQAAYYCKIVLKFEKEIRELRIKNFDLIAEHEETSMELED